MRARKLTMKRPMEASSLKKSYFSADLYTTVAGFVLQNT